MYAILESLGDVRTAHIWQLRRKAEILCER